MRAVITACCLLLATTLAGCGSGTEEPPEGVVPQHQLDAMDKAKNVEDLLQQSEAQRREPE